MVTEEERKGKGELVRVPERWPRPRRWRQQQRVCVLIHTRTYRGKVKRDRDDRRRKTGERQNSGSSSGTTTTTTTTNGTIVKSSSSGSRSSNVCAHSHAGCSYIHTAEGKERERANRQRTDNDGPTEDSGWKQQQPAAAAAIGLLVESHLLMLCTRARRTKDHLCAALFSSRSPVIHMFASLSLSLELARSLARPLALHRSPRQWQRLVRLRRLRRLRLRWRRLRRRRRPLPRRRRRRRRRRWGRYRMCMSNLVCARCCCYRTEGKKIVKGAVHRIA